MLRTWTCANCRTTVQSELAPSPRFEKVSSRQVGPNSFEGIDNTDYQKAANHYGCVCFGPERGEDYREHVWNEVGDTDVVVTIIRKDKPFIRTLSKTSTVENGNLVLPLSEILGAVGYDGEEDSQKGVRIEYWKDGKWEEYYSTGVFSRARLETARRDEEQNPPYLILPLEVAPTFIEALRLAIEAHEKGIDISHLYLPPNPGKSDIGATIREIKGATDGES